MGNVYTDQLRIQGMGPDGPPPLFETAPPPSYLRVSMNGLHFSEGLRPPYCVEENYITCFQGSFMKIRVRIRREYRILVSDRFL